MPLGEGFTTKKPPDYELLCEKLITQVVTSILGAAPGPAHN